MFLCIDLFPVWWGLPISSTQLLLHLYGWFQSNILEKSVGSKSLTFPMASATKA